MEQTTSHHDIPEEPTSLPHHEAFQEEGSRAAPPLCADAKLAFAILASAAFIAWLIGSGSFRADSSETSGGVFKQGEAAVQQQDSELEAAVFPAGGIRTSAQWGSAVPQLVERGVIDRTKFDALFERGGDPLASEEIAILEQPQPDRAIVFTSENDRFTVNVLWALGLAQQSDALDNGPMRTSGTPTGQFASTGGWTLGKSEDSEEYYSKWNLLGLTADDQVRVTRIAETIYRPCCGNSTAFPDCNHGMAMLGLIELMVSQGASDEEVYTAAKAANTYWFPDSMMEIAMYFSELQDMSWDSVDAKIVVSQEYASAQGARKVKLALQEAQLVPQPTQVGGSCGA